MGIGQLSVRATTAYEALPVTNARVRVLGPNGAVLYETHTDASGNTHLMDLTAPDVDHTLDPDYTQPAYSVTEVEVSAPGFVTAHITNVEIVDTQHSILPVEMEPLTNEPGHTTDYYKDIAPVALLLPYPYRKEGPPGTPATGHTLAVFNPMLREAPRIEPVTSPMDDSADPANSPQTRVHNEVFIPDYITVHLGTPSNHAARNVRVPFAQYIKNVTSDNVCQGLFSRGLSKVVTNHHATYKQAHTM